MWATLQHAIDVSQVFFPLSFNGFFHLVDTLSEAYVAYAWYQRTSVEMLNMQMEFKIEFYTLVAQSNFYSINGNSSPSWDTASEKGMSEQGGQGRHLCGQLTTQCMLRLRPAAPPFASSPSAGLY